MRRWQTGAGEWVYRVAVRAWSSRTASTGEDLARDLVEMDVPVGRVRPVTGVSYEGVPVLLRQRPTAAAAPAALAAAVGSTGTGAPAPLVAAATATAPETAGAGGPVWVAAAVKLGVDREIVLHRSDCWVTVP
ncbi:hypothetical protein [Streptomyces sp. NPDC058401]|uniref:hypothetical protein n=1 Tax=Streptomyces sp. NPDC058401 TaxID=3346480 RepID=UPI00365E21A3